MPLETFLLVEWRTCRCPSFTVLKTQICVTRPLLCVKFEDRSPLFCSESFIFLCPKNLNTSQTQTYAFNSLLWNQILQITEITHLIFICPFIIIQLQITANKIQFFLNLFIFTDALHVSGGSSAHHEEHITVHTASGIVNQYCCQLLS